MTQPAPPSPCVNICKMDAHQICIGCGRTLSEIASWGRMTPDQQRQTNQAALRRLRENAGTVADDTRS